MNPPRTLPRISVIITAHNEGAELRRTIESVRENTKQPFEIILIDDASQDLLYATYTAGVLYPEEVRVTPLRAVPFWTTPRPQVVREGEARDSTTDDGDHLWLGVPMIDICRAILQRPGLGWYEHTTIRYPQPSSR